MKILITGGAGFIGSTLAKKLIKQGHDLRILDNFSQQIHGKNQSLDDELSGVDLIIGDVRNKIVIAESLDDIDTIVHLAAETGKTARSHGPPGPPAGATGAACRTARSSWTGCGPNRARVHAWTRQS